MCIRMNDGIKELDNNVTTKKYDEIMRLFNNHSEKINIINIGLLNAGKSSLFNALAGKEVFNSGVIRTTVENQIYEGEAFNLIDTPGLDANEVDSQLAFKAYESGDLFIYVHNAVEGELGRVEVEEIKKILTLFTDSKNFFDSAIFVLSHADHNTDKDNDNLLGIINNQLQGIFGYSFSKMIAVSSKRYFKGLNEGKELLVQHSKINTLCTNIGELISRGTYSRSSIVCKKMLEFSETLTREITNLNLQLKEIDLVTIQNKRECIDKNLSLIERLERYTISNLNRNLDKKPMKDIFTPYISERDYKEYDSHYSAKRAAERELERGLREMISVARIEAHQIVSELENKAFLRNSSQLRANFNGSYSKIKDLYYECQLNSSVPILELNSPNLELNQDILNKLRYAQERSQHIGKETFQPVDYYLKRYPCNLCVDSDYVEKCVSGIFGEKWKWVTVYNWEMQGAIDDLNEAYQRIVHSRAYEYYDNFNVIYNLHLDEWIKQYEEQVNLIKSKMKQALETLRLEKNKLSGIAKQIETTMTNNQKMYSEIQLMMEELK